MKTEAIRRALDAVVDAYPSAIAGQRGENDRFAFQIGVVAKECGPNARIADVGGGWGTFALGCATVGMRPVLIDDFRDAGFYDEATMSAMRQLYENAGVEVLSRDVLKDDLGLAPASFDAITCIDSVEHWHGSPKRIFRSLVEALRPGGLFFLGTPNCVNLRKRITVPLGRGKWSAMADWYEQDVFRGHVREPDVDDLRYIARDIGLENVRIIGRNWAGYATTGPIRKAMPLIDRVLRFRPSLCSDLYLLGNRGPR
jgi:2-polyprenyl-3-methyl-5-hydroxy-6-metoxy-1,4-benzoquinol methylase